jgi:hypothetical protein
MTFLHCERDRRICRRRRTDQRHRPVAVPDGPTLRRDTAHDGDFSLQGLCMRLYWCNKNNFGLHVATSAVGVIAAGASGSWKIVVVLAYLIVGVFAGIFGFAVALGFGASL